MSSKKAKEKKKEEEKKKKEEEEKKKKEEEEKKKEAERKANEPKFTVGEQCQRDIQRDIGLLERGVVSRDSALIARSIRHISRLRKNFTFEIVSTFVKQHNPTIFQLLEDIKTKVDTAKEQADEEAARQKIKEARKEKPKETDKDKEAEKPKDEKPKEKEKTKEEKVEEKKEPLPEVQAYVHLLIVLYLIDHKLKEQAVTATTALVQFLQTFNRRTFDLLSSKIYYYYSLVFERVGQLESIRNNLLTWYRTASLQHNEPGQASLTVAILRNYLHYNLYNQADKFRLNSTFPESRSSDQHARYLYYLGKINTLQLHYSDAFANVNQAIRKAPQKTAVGFQQQANKLLVIINLLMGEIPERAHE